MASLESDFMQVILDFFNDDPAIGYYIKTIQGTYNPLTSSYDSTVIEIPVSIIFVDLTRNTNGLSYDFGTDIQTGDKCCYLLPPNKVDPLVPPLVIATVGDMIRVAGITYRVINSKDANPTSANPLLYQLMLRR